jgi:hypothetical protein
MIDINRSDHDVKKYECEGNRGDKETRRIVIVTEQKVQ